MVRVLIAAFIGSIILFAWGYVSWMVMDWHDQTIKPMPANPELIAQMNLNIHEPGMYMYPPMPLEKTNEAMTELREKEAKGPIVFMHFNGGGVDVPMGRQFAVGYGMNFVTALLAAWIVWLTRGKATSFVSRWGVLLGIAWMSALMSDGMMWNWMYMPDDYTMINAADKLAGILLMGLPIALIIPTDKAAAEASKAANDAAKQSKTPDAPANTEEPPPARPI